MVDAAFFDDSFLGEDAFLHVGSPGALETLAIAMSSCGMNQIKAADGGLPVLGRKGPV